MSRKLAIANALSGWVHGEVILEREFPSDSKIVVVQSDDGSRYSMYRAFILGDRAEVSADVQERSLGDVAAKLLSMIPEGQI